MQGSDDSVSGSNTRDTSQNLRHAGYQRSSRWKDVTLLFYRRQIPPVPNTLFRNMAALVLAQPYRSPPLELDIPTL